MARDIERVIELVRTRFPDLDVVQWQKMRPTDDGGLWWFRLPNVEKDIKLESRSGACPFRIEHDDMKSSMEQWWAQTVEKAANAVVEYLAGQQMEGHDG